MAKTQSAAAVSACFKGGLPRRGYCLGYHVAKRLAAGATMGTMASWDETVFQAKIEGELRALASGP
jgi:hypothetical protein